MGKTRIQGRHRHEQKWWKLISTSSFFFFFWVESSLVYLQLWRTLTTFPPQSYQGGKPNPPPRTSQHPFANGDTNTGCAWAIFQNNKMTPMHTHLSQVFVQKNPSKDTAGSNLHPMQIASPNRVWHTYPILTRNTSRSLSKNCFCPVN